jgi:transposase-like protein
VTGRICRKTARVSKVHNVGIVKNASDIFRYNACKKEVKAKIIEMTLNSSGVRDIGRVFLISKDTVTSGLKKNFIKN